jgi:hypothetical protein
MRSWFDPMSRSQTTWASSKMGMQSALNRKTTGFDPQGAYHASASSKQNNRVISG